MKTVGIDDLKKRLSELIRAVEGGERVLVTRHNRPVVELVVVDSRHLHTGKRFGRSCLKPAVETGSQGAYLTLLKEDRQGEWNAP